jgi:hypothetical protein
MRDTTGRSTPRRYCWIRSRSALEMGRRGGVSAALHIPRIDSQDRECGFESAYRVVGIVGGAIDSVIELDHLLMKEANAARARLGKQMHGRRHRLRIRPIRKLRRQRPVRRIPREIELERNGLPAHQLSMPPI